MVGTWVDSMQTSIAFSEGEWDPSGKTMTYVVEANQGAHRYQEITEHRDDGTLLYRNVLSTPEGGEFEMIRATHRRRPS